MPFKTTEQLQIELHDGVDRRFHTLQELSYHDTIEEGGNGQIYTVPKKTESDGASIPWGLRSIYNPYGVYLKSAVVHDYLYQLGTMPRLKADGVFRRALKSQKISWWKRASMHRAVNLGGGFIWRRRHGKKK